MPTLRGRAQRQCDSPAHRNNRFGRRVRWRRRWDSRCPPASGRWDRLQLPYFFNSPSNFTRTHFVKPNRPAVIARSAHPHLSLRGAQPLMVSLSNHVAISLRLNTHRQTTIATATRLPPPYQVRGRNDRLKWVRASLSNLLVCPTAILPDNRLQWRIRCLRLACLPPYEY